MAPSPSPDAEERYRQLLDDANDVIYTHDLQGRFLTVNRAVERLYGYTADELLGQSISALVAPEDLPKAAASMRRKATGETERTPPYELHTRAKDGRDVWVEVSTRALKQGDQVVAIQGIARDVTERHRRQEAEAQVREHEHREAERLAEMERYKSDFLRMAAHELGTPLTPLRLQVHVLREWAQEDPASRPVEAIAILDRNLERLTGIARDMLLAARLQCGRLTLDPTPMDMARAVQDAVATFAPAAREAGVAIETRLPAEVRVTADAARVAQVVGNLVSNAIKYTPRGGRVTVRADANGEQVRVTVSDSGLGFTPDQARLLFQPFGQVHDVMVAKAPSTGLGLYISKGIIEQHGGAMGCDSPGPGCGADFWFTLPVAAAVPPAALGGAPHLALSSTVKA